jgi:hypothetical protein
MFLSVFNHFIAFFLGRLSIDTFTSVLHCFIVAAWMERRIKTLIWLCAITVFFRINFLVIAGCIGIHVLLYLRPTAQTLGSWFAILLRDAVLAIFVVGMTVFCTDSLWYGRPTLSTWNFISFNMLHDGASNFGRMPLWFYGDKLLLDNNLPLTIGALLALLFLRRQAAFLLPSAAMLSALALIAHKEYRFLFCTQPVLALHAGLFLDRLRTLKLGGPPSGGGGGGGRWARRAAAAGVWAAAGLHALSGASLVCLQAAVYAPHARFAADAAALVRAAPAGGGCLCTFPWCSWLLPAECGAAPVRVVCMYEEFFDGYFAVTHRRFEDGGASALVDVAPAGPGERYRDWHVGVQTDYVAHEARRLRRLARGGKEWAARGVGGGGGGGGALAALGVRHVFFYEISSSPHRRFLLAYANATGGGAPPPPAAVTHHVYHALMLGPALRAGGFALAAEARGVAEPGVFNFDPLPRLLFLWPAAPLPTYRIHSYWAPAPRPAPGEGRGA